MTEKISLARLGSPLAEQDLLRHDEERKGMADPKRVVHADLNFIDPPLSEDATARALAEKVGMPFIDMKRYDIQPQVVRRLTELQTRRFRAVVLEEKADGYLVGIVDPWDLRSQDDIALALKRPLELAVITAEQLTKTIERVYRKTEQIGAFAREVEREVETQDNVIDLASMDRTIDDADAPVVRLLQTIFDDAARVNASDVHFEPQEKTLSVRFRIDGMLHIQLETDPRIASMLVVRLKLLAGLDIAERRLPQDGRISIKSGSSRFDIRMSTMPTQFGESVVLRLLRQDSTRLGLAQIMPERVATLFQKAIRSAHGIVLVTGPTGSGKTTTLYAALEQLNRPEVKILTCEDPVEYRIPGINQVQVNDKIELNFARVLRSFLRQDPDILLVGEIRDSETAEIATRAAMTGHLVLSTLHTNDAPSTPLRLLDMGVPGYLLASSLLAVVSQRLLRLVCNHCAVPVQPPPEDLEWLRSQVSEEEISLAKFRRGRGCLRCNGVGYSGRMGVFEIIEMTTPLALSLHHASPSEFAKLAREQVGRNTLQRGGLELAMSGKSTIAEARTATLHTDSD
jgi:MSHA biogenesis protein MshE